MSKQREEHIKRFNNFVDNKIKDYTEEQKKEYFETKENSALSLYNIDYLNFEGGRKPISEKLESKFF